MIKQEAQLIEPNFVASHWWLRKFQSKYNICKKNNADDVNDDASRDKQLTLSQPGSPRAHTVTQMCDSQQTIILPKFSKPLTSTVSFATILVFSSTKTLQTVVLFLHNQKSSNLMKFCLSPHKWM